MRDRSTHPAGTAPVVAAVTAGDPAHRSARLAGHRGLQRWAGPRRPARGRRPGHVRLQPGLAVRRRLRRWLRRPRLRRQRLRPDHAAAHGHAAVLGQLGPCVLGGGLGLPQALHPAAPARGRPRPGLRRLRRRDGKRHRADQRHRGQHPPGRVPAMADRADRPAQGRR